MTPEQIAQMVLFLKAMADESRLRILGLLATGEHGVDELAELLGLRSPTVSHHLTRLREAGLVSMRVEGTAHLHRLEVSRLHALGEELFAPGAIATIREDHASERWERKVLSSFFEGERLVEIPASRKKRGVVLRWLADQFAFDQRYPERQVNEIILRHHPDYATLRRELICEGLMAREGGIYWRLPDAVRTFSVHTGGRDALPPTTLDPDAAAHPHGLPGQGR